MLKNLVAGRSLPGWITLGWVVLGEIHQGRFALEVLGGITEFFQKHVFIGLLIGFGLLYLSSVWPKLKRHIPLWLRFETIHERIGNLDTRCVAHFSSQGEINASITVIHGAVDSRLQTLEGDTSSTARELSTLVDRVHKVELDISVGIGERLDQQKDWLHSLEQAIKDLRKLFDSRLSEKLVIDARSQFGGLAPVHKQVIKIVYNQPGLLVRDVTDRLVVMGIVETAQAIRAMRETVFLRPATGEQLYPTDNVMVAAEIEQILKASGN